MREAVLVRHWLEPRVGGVYVLKATRPELMFLGSEHPIASFNTSLGGNQ